MKSRALTPRGWLSGCLRRSRLTMWQRKSPPPPGRIDFGELRQPPPLRCDDGDSRCQALEQYYIEQFLRREARLLKGHVLAIGNDFCASEFRCKATVSSLAFAEDNQLICELAALKDHTYDALVMTQVLQFIYDPRPVLKHAHRVLVPGGVLLATLPGSCYVTSRVNGALRYWGFTDLSVRTLLRSTFPARNIKVQSFGNVLVAIAHVHHVAARELTRKELNHRDKHYPFILAIRAEKIGA